MKKCIAILLVLFTFSYNQIAAQLISYSEPDRDDARDINFEIMGKMSGNILVYKNYRDLHYITLFDAQMKQVDKVRLDFLPDHVFNADFLQYPDFFYLFYQYQKRSIVYCMAVKIDAQGKKIGEPVQLDTTDLSYSMSNKIYTILNSEDKQKVMVLKVDSHNEKVHYVTTCLFDKSLALIHKSRINVQMPERNDYITEFQLDNDGDLACVKASGTAQNDNINKLVLLQKPALSDELSSTDLHLSNLYLDDVRLKVDNYNKHYLISSFHSKQRRGNIDGLFCYLFDKNQHKEILNTSIVFNDELRSEAHSEGSVKMAFNDYFLRNIIMKKDGGFIVAAESVYTSSRNNGNMNRWDYFGSPYGSSGFYNYGSPYSYAYPWNRYNSFNNVTRYYADNVAVLSLDVNGKMEWSNIIRKSQYDDNSDNFIGYGLMNTGGDIHFLFNVQEKRDMIFTDQSITPEGQIVRSPTMKNLGKGYDFMPRQIKQTGSRQIIVPCQYRSYICFAKVDF